MRSLRLLARICSGYLGGVRFGMVTAPADLEATAVVAALDGCKKT